MSISLIVIALFCDNGLDFTDDVFAFFRVERIRMGGCETPRIIVEILAGSIREIIRQGRTAENFRADAKIAASHPVSLFDHLAAEH